MQSDMHEAFMRRALELAANGRGAVSPNPMVGAVIVDAEGRIIGQGWHRRYGGPHAEVNAVTSVLAALHSTFGRCTMYVTLEPCSHYGKTPPCAKMLVDKGFGRVVVAATDPNPQVAGRGLEMLRQAGIEVITGVLEAESRWLNRRFFTAHTLKRPYVTLKWAQSADGFMDCLRAQGEKAYKFSTELTSTLVHSRRALHDAIAVGAGTVLADAPRLDTRLFPGSSARPVIFDRHNLTDGSPLRQDPRNPIVFSDSALLGDQLHELYATHGITSLLVEGGAVLLRCFIEAGLWDEAFVEVSPVHLAARGTAPAPNMPGTPCEATPLDGNTIYRYLNFSKSIF